MSRRSAFAAAVALVAGCTPAVRGRCNTTADCRDGAYCALEGICLASSGTCSPACGAGEICSGSTCVALKPVVTVQPPGGPVGPAHPQIAVHVDAAAGIALHALDVEVDDSTHAVASGTLSAPQAGDDLVSLSSFEAGASGSVSVRATLHYQFAGQGEATATSVAVPATIDAAPPTVSVFVPPGQPGAVNGWFPRDGGMIDVRATVDDGAGSGPQSATLGFDTCPATAACTYAGTVVSHTGGVAMYSFLVPRAAQAAGSETPLGVTVKALDAAGNQGQGAGALQIDDAPPRIGAFTVISPAGVAGEDGKTWFLGGTPGGNPAPNVEIAIPVADGGAGFAALALHLDATDLPGFPSNQLDVTGTPAADGIHFLLPASGVKGKEAHLRFTLTATDQLQHAAVLGPDDPRTMIWVDAVPPTIVFGPRVDYSSAAGTGPQCAAPGAGYFCGRSPAGGSNTRLLADDTATVSFDAYDCGAGMASPLDASVATKATPHTAPVSDTGKSGTPCSNGSTNKTHHYQFTLNLAQQALVYNAPDMTGTTPVQLVANLQDRLQQPASTTTTATSGDGVALISLWRWRSLVTQNAQPSGSAALLPGGNAGSRQIAVGTTLTPTSPNFFVLNADGSPAWSATVPIGIGGDVAAGPSGALYTVTPAAGSCTNGCNGAVTIVTAPGSGTSGSAQACGAPNVSLGASPVVATNPERAVVASTNHAVGAAANVFVYQAGACTPTAPSESDLVGTGDYPGISASWPTVFFATGQGFTSVDRNNGDNGFNAGSLAAYNGGATSVSSLAPPSITLGPVNAIFAGAAPDDSVRRAQKTTCATVPCWQDVGGTFAPGGPAAANLSSTPVFDTSMLYTADDKGTVYAFSRTSGGAATWTANFRAALPAPWPGASTATVSPPVLLQGGSALEVRSDGVVALASAAGIVPLLNTQAPLAVQPAAPVIDVRGTGGVAYVHDGAGWIWALQLPSAPATPGGAVWPRPGRDSCNSRNAASQCQ